jgi:transposase
VISGEVSSVASSEWGRKLKTKKWMLLSARESLRHSHKLILAGLRRRNRRLYDAYLLKEQLRELLHYPWRRIHAARKAFERWCDAVLASDLRHFKPVAKRLTKHLDKVLAGFATDVKMGLAEALNGKIAFLRRQARGYRDPEYFKLKIFQRCSLPPMHLQVVV